MHERSLILNLIKKMQLLSANNGDAKITRVNVKLGALSHISPEHFREHFENDSIDTVAEGAQLDIEVLTDETADNAQEIILDSIDIEEPE